MNAPAIEKPQVLHALPGRVRIHLPEWSGAGKQAIEAHMRQLEGILSVHANVLTGNILVTFDPTRTDEQAILAAMETLDLTQADEQTATSSSLPRAIREKVGHTVRAHITVHGLAREPLLAKRIVDELHSRYPDVHAQVSPLTRRVLVEFEEHEAELDDLIATIAPLELPELPGEDRPNHPLDPGPLIQSVTRTIGSLCGLGFLLARRLLGFTQPLVGATTALQVASVISIVQGIPPVRHGLRRAIGRTATDLLFNIPAIVTLTLAESPLGLALVGLEAFRLLTEVLARRSAWRKHEERVDQAPSAQPDAVIYLEHGERTPLAGEVLQGVGTALGQDAMPIAVKPGVIVPPGARLYGGSFSLRLRGDLSFEAFTPESRPAPERPTLYSRYQHLASISSLVAAGATALLTRSFSQTLAALLLVSSRSATIGQESADLDTSARLIREGATVVGTRRRAVRRPDVVLLDGTRLLTERLELTDAQPLTETYSSEEIQEIAAAIAGATDFPWSGGLRIVGIMAATDGTFDGRTATALLGEDRYSLGPVEDWAALPAAASLRQAGNYVLVLRSEHEPDPIGLLALRPQLAEGVDHFVETCLRHRVQPAVMASGDQIAVHAVARRARIVPIDADNAVDAIRARQQEGEVVWFVSDNAGASAAFYACDLAIGLTDDRYRLPAPADLLVPDLDVLAAAIEASARRDAAVRDSVGLSFASNVGGVLWGSRGMPGIAMAARFLQVSALTALADGWLRLRGEVRTLSSVVRLVDPYPERWGRRDVDDVMRFFHSSDQGLTDAQAGERLRRAAPQEQRNRLLHIVFDQVRSPLIAILAAGAGLSLIFGAVGDVVIIGATIVCSVAVSAWQEHKASQVSATLDQMTSSQARVLRDGQMTLVSIDELVPGDVLVLASGDRIAADARVIEAQGLEVDEAALTGESLPVTKVPSGGHAANHIVLEGTDVTVGTGRALVVAVGQQTRMGATRAVLTEDGTEASPLGIRLSRMLRVLIPVSVAGGLTVVGTGLLWGQPLAALLALGATVALAAVPEGLPLLAKVGEAGVARRLADHRAVVRRLSAVEALGRIDVACADKTGTMTRGRLQLSMVADSEREVELTDDLPPPLRHILLVAALASPSPDAPGAEAHPTDVAVVQGALAAGLAEELYVPRDEELLFDPVRAFHVTRVQETLYLKGALEALLPRCRWLLRDGVRQPVDEAMQQAFTQRVQRLAERGLRVLVVAEGQNGTSLDDPQELTMLGFVGLSDPLRDTVRTAVNRCHDAGVRVIMITGDHPSTARAIAYEAGLLNGQGEVLTASDIAELQNGALEQRLERAVVIARATPLDKLRIIESLQRRGHTVAMTGDGVNDAPALRLADVGVAMGSGSTEVARQTADVVIADDDFSTLVEAFVEGRSFWRNIRRSLALLLGGNLGELGLIVGTSLFGIGIPLTARQILAMNAITDILPALAVALQRPEHRNLAGLRREGASALDTPLRNDIFRRATATALPALASYIVTLGLCGMAEARSVAFASVIVTQLAQTLDAGRTEGGLTKAVFGSVVASFSVLAATFTVPLLREFFGLVFPSPLGLLLIGGGALAAVVLSRLLVLSGRAVTLIGSWQAQPQLQM